MSNEPVQVRHDAFGRYCLMREHAPDEKCNWCGGERAHGGCFRYGRESDDSTCGVSWQNEAFCSIGCMRTYHNIPRRR